MPDKPKPETREVYAISDERRGRLKIGISNNSSTRQKDLQTGSFTLLSVTHVERVKYSLAPKVETLARHIAVAQGKKKTREWLAKTTPEEGREFIETAHTIVRGRNSPKKG